MITSSSVVGERFINQQLRFHCQVYCVINVNRTARSNFKRKIWRYKDGDYTKLRQVVQNLDWNSCCDNNIDIYTSNFTRQLISFCETTIPNKIVTTRLLPRNIVPYRLHHCQIFVFVAIATRIFDV